MTADEMPDEFIASILGRRRGGCDCCDAYTVVEADPFGISWLITHEDNCPELAVGE